MCLTSSKNPIVATNNPEPANVSMILVDNEPYNQYMTIANKKVATNDTPPAAGTGTVCELREFGMARTFLLDNERLTNEVRT